MMAGLSIRNPIVATRTALAVILTLQPALAGPDSGHGCAPVLGEPPGDCVHVDA